jgi:ADP-ribose pyrophosphatase
MASERSVFKGRVFNVVRGKARLPNGKLFTYECIRHPDVVIMVPIFGKRVVLLKEYRPTVKRWLVALPGGKIERGESPSSAAKREMREETGFKVDKVKLLAKAFSSPGYTDELAYFYLVRCKTLGMRDLDKNEVIGVMPVTLKKALSMIKTGEIMDAKTIMGLLYYERFVNPKKRSNL